MVSALDNSALASFTQVTAIIVAAASAAAERSGLHPVNQEGAIEAAEHAVALGYGHHHDREHRAADEGPLDLIAACARVGRSAAANWRHERANFRSRCCLLPAAMFFFLNRHD